MAIDKAVDSAVLDAGLKAIADAIREKGGTEDSLAFPDAMAEAIAAIESGGSGGLDGWRMKSGTFVLSSDKTSHEVKLTECQATADTPVVVMLFMESSNEALSGHTFFIYTYDNHPLEPMSYNRVMLYNKGSTGNSASTNSCTTRTIISGQTHTWRFDAYGSTCPLKAGAVYHYLYFEAVE